ncbi:hypothetical protein Daesc_008481 [Daldinia eschscholtzii]|uniref:Zn(2)-C6 fungal-type domain-containing protein n=1 Tax=Daldinia eschscholtzii TaxID=292717 RepID=A0AAX6MBY5_9PEZI
MAGDGSSVEAHAGEILSCVSCRNRKLKCDRTKPRCNRCEKAKLECIFPESRRKPAFKRRNVKELEARLAQVEVLLRETNQNRSQRHETAQPVNCPATEFPETEDILFQGIDFTDSIPPLDSDNAFSFQQEPATTYSTANLDNHGQESTPFMGDLMGLGGIFESLPPFEMMEDLNRIFFERQGHLIPIIHPSRYLQAFYSAPHMKPPMCLQYGIWALAAHGNPKYGAYHDIFYRRARQYAELDELKGSGEHFITVAHAQAWCVIATYEAKAMLFTRAAMSGSRGVRLAQMMGLHRLDGSAEEICPTIITTLLPAPEHAFLNGEEVETCSPKSKDNPDNYEYGEYWKRHRELDNTLSGAFMYLPPSFRLPDNYRDPVAVHTNLNFHASIICLHHAAIEMIEAYKLPESAKKICHDRLSTAAQEIVNIVRLTSHVNSSPTPINVDNLNFVISAMQAFGKNHSITRAYLRQVVIDIERNGVDDIARLPALDNLGPEFRIQITHNIPLLARSKISRHSQVQPPLPGRLPLGKPMGKAIVEDTMDCEHGTWISDIRENDLSLEEARSSNYMNYLRSNKRKRPAPSHGTSTLDSYSENYDSPWAANIPDRMSTNPSAHSSPKDHLSAGMPSHPGLYPQGPGVTFPVSGPDLPHHTDSPHTNASSHPSASQCHTNPPTSVNRWNLTGIYRNAIDTQSPASPTSPCNLSANNDHIPWFLTSENVSVDWGGVSLSIDPGETSGR